MVSQKIIFVFSILNFFFKVGAKHVKYKNYYLKTSFKFNFFWKLFLYYFEYENKNPPTNQVLRIPFFFVSLIAKIVDLVALSTHGGYGCHELIFE